VGGIIRLSTEGEWMNKDVLPVGEIPDRPYSIRDESDHFSLINFLSDRLKQAVMDLPDEFLVMTEAQLKGMAQPTPTDYALRVSFWREFEKMMWKGSGKIVCASVYAGICSDPYFYQKFITNEAKFAWMIRPMQAYQKEMEAILYRCTERLWELTEITLTDKKGKLDAKAGDLLLKTLIEVSNRVKGMAVQRSEQRNLNVNVVTRSKANQGIETMSSIDERIKQLELEVSGESSIDRGKDRVGNDQVVSVTTQKAEREVVHVGLLRSQDPSIRE